LPHKEQKSEINCDTPPKLNIPPENSPFQKERLVFQSHHSCCEIDEDPEEIPLSVSLELLEKSLGQVADLKKELLLIRKLLLGVMWLCSLCWLFAIVLM